MATDGAEVDADGEPEKTLTPAEVLEEWKRAYAHLEHELKRSENVQGMLGSGLSSLQQKIKEAEDEVARIRREALLTPAGIELSALRARIQDLRGEAGAVNERRAAVVEAQAQQTAAEEESAFEIELVQRSLEEVDAACTAIQQAHIAASERKQSILDRAKSMVSKEALERAAAEAQRLQEQLREQEAEAAKLRQALADSWAARANGDGEQGRDAERELAALDNVEEELKFLAEMQREAAAEVHRVQHLERTQAALQAKLKKVTEEKAVLQSARIDLGDAGKAMREAIAYQSEGFVRRVGGLEQARKMADEDRVKLIQASAELQARLDELAPQLAGLTAVEGQHSKLEAERRALTNESQRLRDVNAALGAQLLGDTGHHDPDVGSVAEAVSRVLQLQKRMLERKEAQENERQKLVERIRALEREAAKPDALPVPPTQAPTAKSSGRGGSSASSSAAGLSGGALNVLRGLRDAAINSL